MYAPRADFFALAPWQRYAVRVHALRRTHPDAILCLESAGVLHGVPQFGETKDLHLLDPGRSRSRRFGDVCVHTGEDPRELTVIAGSLVTSLADTVSDLARLLPPAKAVAVVDSALSLAQGGTLSIEDVATRLAEQRNRRGRVRAQWALAKADARAESPSESISRIVIAWSGFETPNLQHRFHYEGADDRVDFYFPLCRAIGEADGWQKYRSDDPEKAARTLTHEERREDRLRRHRHPFARWDLADAWRVDPLCDVLHAAGVPQVRPIETAMLASLRQSPREVRRQPTEKPRPL